MPAARRLRSLLLALAALAAGCGPQPGDGEPPPLPRSVDEPVAVGPPIAPKPGALPSGARVQWPAFDGDAFWVDLPETPQAALTPAEARARYVAPLLDALGVVPGEVTLSDLPADPPPAASPAALLRIARARVERTPALLRKETRRMLAALGGAADPAADAALARAEGRTRDAALADLGRRELRYHFVQVVAGVPVEYALVSAARREGRSVNGVRGAVLTKWTLVNAPTRSAGDALKAALRALEGRPGLGAVAADDRLPPPALVLLPYGRDAGGRARLHHAYRLHLAARFSGMPAQFVAWIDAADGTLLKLKPLLSAVAAAGLAWERDPRDPPSAATFEVDAAVGGQYTLQRQGVFQRLHVGAAGDQEDVSVAAAGATADFDEPGITDAAAAVCGTNRTFQQVHAFATLSRLREDLLAQGMPPPYPPFGALAVNLEAPSTGCNAWSSVTAMLFGACGGAASAGCPGPRVNFAHDATMLAHELGHTATKRLVNYRLVTGPMSPSLEALEDLADFWAAHLTWTNCIGGWVGADTGGAGQGLDCARHHEGSGFPRRLELPADRFPDKRVAGSAGTNPCKPADPAVQPNAYCNGQVAAAALWDARLGVRSRSPLLGVPEFGARVHAALLNLVVPQELDQPPATDVKVYRLLQGLLLELTKQYASSSSASMTNKILAGFARAGLFVAPYQCLALAGGGQGAEPAATCAPGAPADAIVDVDDRETTDDPVIAGVRHRQTDYFCPSSAAPRFHVWTGPRYRLNLATGKVHLSGTAPCHRQFLVEVSTSPDFPDDERTISSGWKNVGTSAGSDTACHGTWTPRRSRLPLDVPGTRLYYRARTRPSAGGPELVSTLPGAGLVAAIPPPFALVTADGLPEY